MFPKVPEDLSNLSLAELKTLQLAIRDAGKTVKRNAELSGGTLSPDNAAAVLAGKADLDRLNVAIAAEEAKLADEAAEADAAAAALDALSAEDEVAADDADEAADEDVADEDDAEDEVEETTAAAAPVAKVTERAPRPKARPATQALAVTDATKPVGSADVLKATKAGALGVRGNYESWRQLSEDMIQTFPALPSGRKEVLATIDGNYEGRTLSENAIDNLELTAAMCAPATPYYNLGCMNTTRRPVFGALPQFAAPRGAVSIYPSPTLSDVDGVAGIWTAEDDANPAAVKNDCAVIECADSETYRIYGVYRCLTVKNMSQLTFPELTEAYVNRLAASHSRLAEIQLLNAMATEADLVEARPLDFDGPVHVATQLAESLALHQEAQRWDNDGDWLVFLPRWVQAGIRVSLMRRRVTNGQGVRTVTDAEINAIFTNVGFRPVWFIDTPTWAQPIPAVRSATSANPLPTRVDAIVAPPSKFGVMDRGQLSVGVAANNIYRDNASNKRNEFTMFFENFEGLVNTDSCPAYRFKFTGVSWNGVQVGDIAAPEADGTTIGS